MRFASRLLLSHLSRVPTRRPLPRFHTSSASNSRPRARKPPHNPGVTLSQFRDLFQPVPDHLALSSRRRLRWDWHLRNFLTALIPPALLYLFLKLAAKQFHADEQEYGRVFVTEERDEVTDAEGERDDPMDQYWGFERLEKEIQERLAVLEQQIQVLQNERNDTRDASRSNHARHGNDLAQEDPVQKARELAKTLQRKSPS